MIVFRMMIFCGAVAFITILLWYILGRRAIKKLFPEDRPLPRKWNPKAVEFQQVLYMRREELKAKKKELQAAQRQLDVAKETTSVTEELAQTEMRLQKTEDRLERLDRVRDQQLHLS